MAYTAKLNRVIVPLNDGSNAVTAGELLKTDDGMPIDFGGKDIRTLIRIATTVSGGDEITIVGGTGEKGIGDQVIAVDGVKYVWLDSAYFMQVSGTYKGCVIIKSKNATSSNETTVEAVTVA